MDEKEKSEQEPSENESFKDPELMSLMNDLKNSMGNEVNNETDDENDIIELTQDMIISLEDDIIELTDIVESEDSSSPVESEQEIIMKDLEEDMDSEEYIKDDFAASIGMEIESDLDSNEEFTENNKFDFVEESRTETEDLAVSPQQVEAAIERVVRSMLGDKIDSILVEVIEKAVTQEISRLKNILRVNENDFE